MASAPVIGATTGEGGDLINVEVVYAGRQRQLAIQLSVPSGSTLQQAIEASGIVRSFPEIDLAQSKLGVYGRLAKADTVLTALDRVEIYRPLLADPKDIRKQRAAAAVQLRGKAKR